MEGGPNLLYDDRAVPRFDLDRPLGRLKAYGDYLWTDHAYLRAAFQNAHWIDRNLVRTNQPWPFQLRWWRQNGIRSVINLRGGGFETSFYVLEREACARLGLTLIDFPVSSREAPSAAQVSAARALFERTPYPAVMHCKSGADRAGIMSVLYAHLHLGLPLREALRELSFRHLHVRAGKTGVIDFALDKYLREVEPTGVSFFDWTQSAAYDPAALKSEFRAGWWGTLLTERLLRRE